MIKLVSFVLTKKFKLHTVIMQLLASILIYPIIWLLSILPTRVLYGFSSILFAFLFYIVGYRRKVVRNNLKLCFPEKSEKERKIIEKKFYQHFCDMIFESIKSLTISEAEIKRRFVFTNIEEIHKIENVNKSMMMMCAHYGSWEWIFILQKHVSSDGYAVYKKLKNKYFDGLVRRIRAKYNTYLITTKETVFTLRDLQSKGEIAIFGFLSDQSPKAEKARHWKEFMGVKVPVYTGAEGLAKDLDMAVLFFKTKKIKRGYYETTFKTVTLNPNEYKDYEITDMFIEFVEELIYDAPEYYLWTHKRWKHKDKVPIEFQ